MPRMAGKELGSTDLRKVYAEGAHVQTVEEAAETLVETAETLVQELEVHEVGFEISHAVAQLGKLRLESSERIVLAARVRS